MDADIVKLKDELTMEIVKIKDRIVYVQEHNEGKNTVERVALLNANIYNLTSQLEAITKSELERDGRMHYWKHHNGGNGGCINPGGRQAR